MRCVSRGVPRTMSISNGASVVHAHLRPPACALRLGTFAHTLKTPSSATAPRIMTCRLRAALGGALPATRIVTVRCVLAVLVTSAGRRSLLECLAPRLHPPVTPRMRNATHSAMRATRPCIVPCADAVDVISAMASRCAIPQLQAMCVPVIRPLTRTLVRCRAQASVPSQVTAHSASVQHARRCAPTHCIRGRHHRHLHLLGRHLHHVRHRRVRRQAERLRVRRSLSHRHLSHPTSRGRRSPPLPVLLQACCHLP